MSGLSIRAKGSGRALILTAAVLTAALCAPAGATRIKDVTSVEGVRSNQVFGVGLVVGLAGTGGKSDFTEEVARNVLLKMRAGRGLPEDLRRRDRPSDLKTGNVSVVMCTAQLPAFVRKGTTIDVTISAMDESSSLRGGTLLFTPLMGVDEEVYAVAQGSVSVGGFQFAGQAATVQQGHPTVGIIPNGGAIEKEVPMTFLDRGSITLCLHTPDFTTATRIAEAINAKTRSRGEVLDAGTVQVKLSAAADQNQAMQRISEIQGLEVIPDSQAIVVINERTGTVVAGQDVSISTVAISHGNLTVIVQEKPSVSQPGAFAPSGQTVTMPHTEITIIEKPLKEGGLTVLNRSATVSEVARALNMLGASPRDIISIFQALKEAGALHADLRIM